MDKIRKNLFVCVDRGCTNLGSMSCCSPTSDDFVPADCEYAILHLLQAERMEIAQKDRRTGKTTILVRIAEMLARNGYWVYFVSKTCDMGEHTRRNFSIALDRVKMCSVGQARAGRLRGLPAGYIVSDELDPSEQAEVQREMIGSKVVAAYWT